MLSNTVFSFSGGSFSQGLALVGNAIFYIGFFVWVARLVRS
jgi:hypothetical protein